MEAKNKISESKRFILACIMIFAGIVLLFLSFYTHPIGEITSSVLGASGELFVFAGSLLSLDSYVNWKIHKYLTDNDKKE